MTARIYEYGCREPTLHGNLVDDQMRAAHRYRNTLTEIERERRAKARVVLGAHADTEPMIVRIADLVSAREPIVQLIKATRSSSRSRSESADLRLRSRAIGAEIKALRAQLKEAKRRIAADSQIQAALAVIDEQAAQRQRDERARCSVFWGSYLLVEAAAAQARKGKMDPDFRRSTHDRDLVDLAGHELWLDEGRVGVQIQKGIGIEDLADDTRVQILEAPDGREGRRAGTYRRLRIRIGSEGTAPIWAEWPMIMHRPLPSDARIKGVTVSRRHHDRRRWEWRVQIHVDLPATPRKHGPICALNLGWCQRDDGGLRAGYVIGSDGHEEEIVLSPSVIDRVEKAAKIRSQRDVDLNVMRDALVPWMRGASLPDWIRQRCVLDREGRDAWHVGQWRSDDRFTRLAQVWRQRRWEGDEIGYSILESWRYRDEHLQRYERGLERSGRAHRRELYRRAAAVLARRYATLVIDDTDLRDMQRSPRPDEDRQEIATVKRQQQITAPYELRLTMQSAFSREGRVDKLPAANLTARCYDCGAINVWDRVASGRRHTCTSCGVSWDQDANACRNLLREWSNTADEREAARVAKLAIRKPSRTERFLAAKLRKREAKSLETQ